MLKALLLAALCAWTIAAAPAAAPEVLHERQSQGLHARMKAKGRYFGTFSDNRYLGDQPYVNILKNTDEFISITPGNSMKWDTTEVLHMTLAVDHVVAQHIPLLTYHWETALKGILQL